MDYQNGLEHIVFYFKRTVLFGSLSNAARWKEMKGDIVALRCET